MAKKSTKTSDGAIATNRRVRYDYEILDTYEAGISLLGSEVKSLRVGHAVRIEDAHIQQMSTAHTDTLELEMVNLHIPEYKQANKFSGHLPLRPRKLLLHKREIRKILDHITRGGCTAIPLKMYFNKDGRIKVQIAVAKGKKTVDKRHAIKDREWNINKRRTLKNYNA